MPRTVCMTSNCTLDGACTRHEDDAGKHLLTRTYADSGEALVCLPGRPHP